MALKRTGTTGEADMTAVEIGARMRERRRRLHMTQDQVCARLGTRVPTYSHWENGTHSPGPGDMAAIAGALGCHVGYLYGEISEEQMADEEFLRVYRSLPPALRAAVRSAALGMAVQVQEGRA